jgi:hypothetical protein
MKEDQTKEVSLNVSEDAHWAYCPHCKDVWDTKCVLYGFSRCLPSRSKGHDPLAEKLPKRLCPDHAWETVVDGRRMGLKKALSGDQLNEIKNNYWQCPVCRSRGKNLEWKVDWHPGYIGPNEAVLSCRQCHALILLGILLTVDAEGDEWEELIYVLYREDLHMKEQKELDEAWNTIHRITNRQGSKSNILCE